MSAQMLREIASGAFGDAIDILLIIATLEASNTPAVVDRINAANTAPVALCIDRALWSRLVLIVTRAYADARSGDRHAQQAFELLKDTAVRSEIEKTGNSALLDEAIALWAQCRGDHRRERIGHFRDKQIAHLGQLTRPPPIIDDILVMSRKTATALERLAQGAGVVTLSLDNQLKVHQAAVDRFWS
jgi:AbiU2